MDKKNKGIAFIEVVIIMAVLVVAFIGISKFLNSAREVRSNSSMDLENRTTPFKNCPPGDMSCI